MAARCAPYRLIRAIYAPTGQNRQELARRMPETSQVLPALTQVRERHRVSQKGGYRPREASHPPRGSHKVRE